jgi:hypothetical protein
MIGKFMILENVGLVNCINEKRNITLNVGFIVPIIIFDLGTMSIVLA